MTSTHTSENNSQLNVLDIEAFKKKYNIPDSEDAVKFVQASVKPFPMQKRYVPVKAYSKMGMDGYFTDMGYDGNAGDGYVPTHSAGPRAYGIKGTGDSMFPAIRNGWYVVCDPDAEPVPMEFVQVCLKDGRCTIKEFIGIQNDVLSLIAVNGGERLTLIWMKWKALQLLLTSFHQVNINKNIRIVIKNCEPDTVTLYIGWRKRNMTAEIVIINQHGVAMAC
jgi:SOS-response transcriptional repressor LexA